VVSYW